MARWKVGGWANVVLIMGLELGGKFWIQMVENSGDVSWQFDGRVAEPLLGRSVWLGLCDITYLADEHYRPSTPRLSQFLH